MAGALVLMLALAQLAFAFSETSPLLAWSTREIELTSSSPDPLSGLLSNTQVCQHDTIIFVNHPGVHASDLSGLHQRSHIGRSLASAKSTLQLPYVQHNASDLTSYAYLISERCSSRLVFGTGGNALGELDADTKNTVFIDMPALELSGSRKDDMVSHDALLSTTLPSSLPNSLIIYTGTPSPQLSSSHSHLKRSSFLTLAERAAQTPSGILARYQLLTPGLIICVLVVVLILLPIFSIGVQALSSIQSPVAKSEAPKGWSASEKKEQ